MRVSVVDVRLAFGQYAEALRDMDVDTSTLELQEAQSGLAYRAFLGSQPAPGTTTAAFNGGYLGNTAREAQNTLRTMVRTLAFAHAHFTR